MKNKKITITSLIILASVLIVSLFAFIPFQRSDRHNVAWMKQVDDNTKIAEMSIPGTHDSGATHSLFDVAGKCQDLSIKSQLNIGVRFFDIRLQLVNDNLNIVHSFVDQKLKFDTVLNDFTSYIKENNSEFLIISLKEDADDKNSTISFEDKLIESLSKHKDVISFDNSLPETIKDARGKIFILSRCNIDIGIPAYFGWADSTSFELNNLYVQDNYCINDIDVKKQDILNTIKYSKTNTDKLVLNFTSCYLDNAFPPSYAGTAARLINPWFYDVIDNDDKLGIIVADFITLELAKSIYMRNIA